jgi:hypothetical protein
MLINSYISGINFQYMFVTASYRIIVIMENSIIIILYCYYIFIFIHCFIWFSLILFTIFAFMFLSKIGKVFPFSCSLVLVSLTKLVWDIFIFLSGIVYTKLGFSIPWGLKDSPVKLWSYNYFVDRFFFTMNYWSYIFRIFIFLIYQFCFVMLFRKLPISFEFVNVNRFPLSCLVYLVI